MKHVAQIAIDDLTQLALYSEECGFGNVCDDELYNLLHEGSGGYYDEDGYGYMEAVADPMFRRMYFLFMAEMLKTPWTYVAPKPKTTFDGVAWLFDNHWITYDDILRVREAEREYNEP